MGQLTCVPLQGQNHRGRQVPTFSPQPHFKAWQQLGPALLRIPRYFHCLAAGTLFAADEPAASCSSSEFLVYLAYSAQLPGIQLSAGSWQHPPSWAHPYNEPWESRGDCLREFREAMSWAACAMLPAIPQAGMEWGAHSPLTSDTRSPIPHSQAGPATARSQPHHTPVHASPCYRLLKFHLFSLPFVVAALPVLTPDPAELLFSSFNNCVYQLLGGWLFSPCQSSAILSPSQDAFWSFPA